MKIACIDNLASTRMQLQKVFEAANESAMQSVGSMTFADTYPASQQEVLVSSPPDVIAIGAGYTCEEQYMTCREIRSCFPDTPLFVFLKPETYSLRTLRRFHALTTEIFCTDETSTRLIHTLSTLSVKPSTQKDGKLIVATGVKGGVGTTTLTSGLAHAAQALDQETIVIDLSQTGALIHYMLPEYSHSPDYAAALLDGLTPDKSLVERCITTAPNGIHLLLPPAGGSDVREKWLRDPHSFELTLTMIDLLRDIFDLVFVDTAGVEGVLPFALNTRAHTRLLISSNEPASVHLLSSKLSLLFEYPGTSQIHILINALHERLLTKEDIFDFLFLNEHFDSCMMALDSLPFDQKGQRWVGTGNTFYTEASSGTQEILEKTLTTLLLTQSELQAREKQQEGIFSGIRRLAEKSTRRGKYVESGQRALPEPEISDEEKKKESPEANPNVVYASFAPEETSSSSEALVDLSLFYEPPRETTVNKGG